MEFQDYYSCSDINEKDYKKTLQIFKSYKKHSNFLKVLKNYKCDNVIPNTLAEFKMYCKDNLNYRKTLVLVDSIIRNADQCGCEGINYNEVYKSSMKYIHIYDNTDEYEDISEFKEYYS